MYILKWLAFLRSFFLAININMDDASLLVIIFLVQNMEVAETCTLTIWVVSSSILLKMDCKERVLIESKIIGVSRCECLDYLCDIATRMKLHGLDPTAKPKETSDNGAVWCECAINQHNEDTFAGNVYSDSKGLVGRIGAWSQRLVGMLTISAREPGVWETTPISLS